MKWFYFGLAVVFDIVGATILKMSDGNEKWHLTILSLTSYLICFWAFGKALKNFEVGTAYATAAGIGIIGTTLMGIFYFKDTFTFLKFIFICLILVGTIGLNVLSSDK
jgi:small multidrug resistance pump